MSARHVRPPLASASHPPSDIDVVAMARALAAGDASPLEQRIRQIAREEIRAALAAFTAPRKRGAR